MTDIVARLREPLLPAAECRELRRAAADEIERLRAEVARLTPPPRGPTHMCNIPGCAVCDYTAGL